MKIDLYNDDCFNILKDIPDGSVDFVLTDPPYGTTAIKWDNVLDFNRMWVELERITKPKANIIFFASQPFTSLLITSKLDWFKYELIWNKNKCGSPGLAKYRPNKVHENIVVFSRESGATYNPIMEEGDAYERKTNNPKGYGTGTNTHGYGFGKKKSSDDSYVDDNGKTFVAGFKNKGTRYPKSILHASRNFSAQQTVHPTQKPTNVLNWLIMTYSNPNDVVLDFTMGSGSTGVSAKLTGRDFIGIELDKKYFNIAKDRIDGVEPNIVTTQHHQLTTQLHKDMKTTPDKKPEKIKKVNNKLSKWV